MKKRDHERDRVVVQNLASIHGARLEGVFNQLSPAHVGASVPASIVTTLLHHYGEKETAPERDEMEVYLEDKMISRQNADPPEAK